MASGYIALLVFMFVALVVPASLLLASLFLRVRRKQNPVSGLNFESGERTVGGHTGIMQEYFHYFTGFLAFEVVSAIFIVWVYASGALSGRTDDYVIAFMVMSLFLEYFVILLALRRVNDR